MRHPFARRLAALLAATLCTAALAQSGYAVPSSTARAVLTEMAAARGYAVVWSEGIPDFPTREGEVRGDLASAARQVVSGAAYGATNLYCPAATRFPATAYTLDARLDDNARIVFVVGVPTSQECRPLPRP